jgi:hypothetical protein
MLIDECDRHLLCWNWTIGRQGYYRARMAGVPALLHRVIAGAAKGQCVDHINGDRTDNRRENLRICSQSENRRNRAARFDSKAPYKGITFKSGKWVAQIQAHHKYYNLGRWDTAEAAAAAYDKAALELHGAFARTNFSGSASGNRVIEAQKSA